MTTKTLRFSALLAYGLFGLPLAMVALPIYVYVPQFYSERFHLSLSLIGGALLLARVFDAFIDPAMGAWIDRTQARTGYPRFILIAAPVLAAGYFALFHPLMLAGQQPFAWFLASLAVVYAGFSLASIAHQSWGAALTQQAGERIRLTSTREACGLIGVIGAAALSQLAGIAWLSLAFMMSLLLAGFFLIRYAPRPLSLAKPERQDASLRLPFQNRVFRWLFAVFVMNGIAAAIPATLFLFFVRDRLQLAASSGIFLILYFVAGAFSMPLWVLLASRIGEARAWLAAMLLSVIVFVWAYLLGAGDTTAFGVICVLSGFTLGADLALPPALLAAVIRDGGHSGRREGAYFGVWSWATKMNLALAAGISLPLLEYLGYLPGAGSQQGLQALSVAYALVPCALKLAAFIILWRSPLRDLR
ncbi:MFS transporter [Undibacterium terreum]|uniref:MFS transporter n=1 Tax=Undibacterium terreum TaxID=1224302 RepID=A0A916V1D7_9BURK|nr:MFS transporter [Undibacterium terreum]GGD01837.1 MFS transporter [Undibacterium terreum]